MKIKQAEIEINESTPFANCKLNREKDAKTLTKIVNNYKDGFVLAVNNEWGAGKTTFLKMWRQQLKNDGYKTVFFNAWENDFETNPLVALISELKTLTDSNTEKAFISLVEKGAILTRAVIPELLKAILAPYIDSEIVLNTIKNTTEGATEIFEKEIDSYNKRKEGIKGFKSKLSEFIENSKNDKPIIFIIDELDRCRPDYAVLLLEQLKHLFSVSGIVFVLSIDKVQLGNAVRGVYGSDKINADEYLRRFIDLEFSIPLPDINAFCNYLFEEFNFNEFFNSENRANKPDYNNDKASFLLMATYLFEKTKLSLRQQEKVFAHARIGLTLFDENQQIYPELYLILTYLNLFEKDFFNDIELKKFTLQELLDNFMKLIPRGLDLKKLDSFIKVEAQLSVMYHFSLTKNLHLFETRLGLQTQDGTPIVKSRLDESEFKNYYLHYLKVTLGKMKDEGGGIPIEYLINKVSLTANILN